MFSLVSLFFLTGLDELCLFLVRSFRAGIHLSPKDSPPPGQTAFEVWAEPHLSPPVRLRKIASLE